MVLINISSPSWKPSNSESAAPPLPPQQASVFGFDLDPHQARKISVLSAQYRSKARNKCVHCSGRTSAEFFWLCPRLQILQSQSDSEILIKDIRSLQSSRRQRGTNTLDWCGQDNRGLFVGIAGLLGLGRNKISLIEQTAAKYGRYFSYCLPVDQSSTGFLRLGNDGGNSAAVKFTPLTTLRGGESFYGLDLVGISVSGQQVSIPSTVFSTGTLIDSGTEITQLPAAAYTAMRDAFREGMKSYGEPKTVLGNLDTCYDLRAYNLETVSFPAVAFTFSGGLTLELKLAGTVIVIVDTSQVCLAFSPTPEDRLPGIIGNIQQIGFEVVYDVAGGKIGFATGRC